MVLLFYPDGARCFPRRQGDQGERPGPRDIPEHGPQCTAIRRHRSNTSGPYSRRGIVSCYAQRHDQLPGLDGRERERA